MAEEIEFKKAENFHDFQSAVRLFRAYEASLDFKIDFQNFEDELLQIQQMYARPEGSLTLAVYQNQPVGVIALRKWTEEIAEIKRMFVLPAYRKKNIGRKLLKNILAEAVDLGYEKVRLDTLKRMQTAVNLYQESGFYQIDAYRPNPLPDALFMEKKLMI